MEIAYEPAWSTHSFKLVLSQLMLILTGMSQAMVISCCCFHSQTVFASKCTTPPTARMWASGVPYISPLHLRFAAKPVILINRGLDFCGETLRLGVTGCSLAIRTWCLLCWRTGSESSRQVQPGHKRGYRTHPSRLLQGQGVYLTQEGRSSGVLGSQHRTIQGWPSTREGNHTF